MKLNHEFGIFVGKNRRLIEIERNISDGYFPDPRFDQDWEQWEILRQEYPIGTLLYETDDFGDGLAELNNLKELGLPQLNLATPGMYRWAFLPRGGTVQLTYMGLTKMPQINDKSWIFSVSKGMCRARIPAEVVAYSHLSPILLELPDYTGNDQRPAPWKVYDNEGLLWAFIGNDGKIIKAIGETRSGTGWEAYEDERFRGLSLNAHDGFEIYPIMARRKTSFVDKLFGASNTVC